MKFQILFLISILLLSCESTQNPLVNIIESDGFLNKVAGSSDGEVQIIYTQIDRDKNQTPGFTTYYYGFDSSRYFYPASTVKLPASLLALEKINHLNIKGFSKETRIKIDSAFSRQSKVSVDSTAPGLKPTISHYIKKILLASDNDAYNRLYEFLGQDYLNENLREKGYSQTRIIHRLSISRTPEENLHSNPMQFFNHDSMVYEQALSKSKGQFYPDEKIFKGKGYEENGKIVNQPFDFTYKNFYPLNEQHQLITALFFPDKFNAGFDLTNEDYKFLHHYMGMLPDESDIAVYHDSTEYWNSYVKFLIYGSDPTEKIPSNLRVFNKIGLAYGYLIDNAYIVDFDNGVEFILSAVIHTNENQIYNDGKYEYDSIGFPFLKRLGIKVLQLERSRKKAVLPDLSELESLFNYSNRK